MAMPYTSKENIRRFAEADVNALKRNARYVICIDKNGNQVSFAENQKPISEVLVIIGPATLVSGIHLDATVLLEIGLGRSKPYTTSRNRSSGKMVYRRRRYISITKEQLENILPKIEEILVKNLEDALGRRKRVSFRINYSKIKSNRIGFRHTKRKGGGDVFRESSVRISVSQKDSHLLSVLFKTEMIKRRVDLVADMKIVAGLAQKRLNARVSDDAFLKRELKKEKSNLGDFVDFLSDRKLRPHQIYHLLKVCNSNTRQNLTTLLIYLGYDLDRVKRFGFMSCDVKYPVLESDIHLYCQPLRNGKYVSFDISFPPESFVSSSCQTLDQDSFIPF